MRKSAIFAVFLLMSGVRAQTTAGRFDGTWNTTLTCDAKGNSLGYTWHFQSTINNSYLHGERGTQGEPGYLTIDGKLNKDGGGKLTANGIVASTQYTHGPFVKSGEDYSYDVKAQFQDTEGKGERSTGLGIYGRPCHYEWARQTASETAPKP